MFQVPEKPDHNRERGIVAGSEFAMLRVGECCHRQERSGNVCGFMKQEKVNSAGSQGANVGCPQRVE